MDRSPAAKTARFSALDGLRGIAAGAVALVHLKVVLGVPLSLKNAALAVDFFFMLSGFVLAHGYLARLNAASGRRAFLVGRLIRLFPLIALGTLVGAVAHLISERMGGDVIARYLAQGLLLVPELGPYPDATTFMPLDPPAWSLFFEMIASILFALGLWRGSFAMSLGAVVVAGAAVARFALFYGSFDMGWSYDSLWAGLARVTFAFGLGAVLYRAVRAGFFLPLTPRFAWVATSFGLLLLWLASNLTFQFLCVFILFPIILLAGAQVQRTRWSGLLEFMGELSYPLYILHWPVYLLVGLTASTRGWTSPSVAATAVICALSAAVLASRAFDRPVRRSLSGMFLSHSERREA